MRPRCVGRSGRLDAARVGLPSQLAGLRRRFAFPAEITDGGASNRWTHKSRNRGLRRATMLVLALVVATMIPAGASAGDRDGDRCIFPDGGDLNEAWGVSESIVWFFCDEVGAGQDWRVAEGWGMNETFEELPDGFVPAGATPLDDFLAKFVGVKVVVDPGTPQERIYRFTDVSLLTVMKDDDGSPIPVVNGVTMGTLRPLRVGEHVVESYWTMSAMHCDGFPIPDGGCLAAGDNLAFATAFEVTSGNR